MAMNSLAPQEGASHLRPPLFDGNNYSYWKTRMQIHLCSLGVKVWKSVLNGYQAPTIEDATTKLTREKLDSEWDALDRENCDKLSCLEHSLLFPKYS